MRLKTIQRRLQRDGVSKRTLRNVHSRLFGYSDADTIPGGDKHHLWQAVVAEIKREQRYFRGMAPKKKGAYDFTSDSFIK